MQDNGPHWVGYFAKAPELLTSKKEDCCLASLSMNGALETELKAMELQLEVCIQVPKALKSELKAMELQLGVCI